MVLPGGPTYGPTPGPTKLEFSEVITHITARNVFFEELPGTLKIIAIMSINF